MPPKITQKDPEDTVSQLLIEKLRENQELQDAKHATITTILHNITERLADIRFVPPIPPDPLQGSPINVTSSHITHNSHSPPINPPNTQHPHPPLYTSPQQYPHSPSPPTHSQPYNPSHPRPPKLQLTPFDGSNLLE
ncbi:PREDICTED: early nodulin-75-like [Lupinus angustifolius]|uniref:early nodulin-75-like n=1 Tax=Lupinus angustifolius TaxID=3871 RepID=UPI00092F72E7|nr:PREDICTED: early nodulin-75-like [Lupinus angustifolius]